MIGDILLRKIPSHTHNTDVSITIQYIVNKTLENSHEYSGLITLCDLYNYSVGYIHQRERLSELLHLICPDHYLNLLNMLNTDDF